VLKAAAERRALSRRSRELRCYIREHGCVRTTCFHRPTSVFVEQVKVVGYVRVSTERQAEMGLGQEIQDRAIRSWARQHRHQVVLMLCDAGVSGARELDDRPALLDAIEAVRSAAADGLVVFRLDRLARDLVVQEQLLRELWSLDATVFSTSSAECSLLTEDAEDPARRLIRQVLGAVAEYERSIIALRLRAGRRRKAASGGYAGYGSPPLGWTARGGELVVSDAERCVVERIVVLRAESMSYRQVAHRLEAEGLRPKRGGRWHATTIARIVERHRRAARLFA
jgi:DNA invertase Pin-like site-specific DNA recombinase